jgi:toxin ParE1/3/4
VNERRYPVVWTGVAAQDIERLAAYLLDEAPPRAEQINERIISRGESLGSSSERGRTPPELRAIGDRTWHEVQEPPWRILYRITGKRIEIHGVLDGRRSLEDILMERLLQAE